MPVTIQTNKVKFKNPNNQGFIILDAIGSESVQEIQSKINDDVSNALKNLNDATAAANASADAIAQAVSEAVAQGTDQNLILSGIPADAKVTGDAIGELKDTISDIISNNFSYVSLTMAQANIDFIGGIIIDNGNTTSSATYAIRQTNATIHKGDFGDYIQSNNENYTIRVAYYNTNAVGAVNLVKITPFVDRVDIDPDYYFAVCISNADKTGTIDSVAAKDAVKYYEAQLVTDTVIDRVETLESKTADMEAGNFTELSADSMTAKTLNGSSVVFGPSNYQYTLEDGIGNILYGVDDDGKLLTRPEPDTTGISIKTNLSHFIEYGQSWSVGYSVTTQPVIPYPQIYNNLMFKGGVIAWKSSLQDKYGSFVPLEEQKISGYYETPVSGQCNMVKRLLISENGYAPDNYQIIGTAPGEGAKSLDQLKKGTDYYGYLMDAVTNAKAIADAEHKIYTVDAVSWIQGTLDASGLSTLQNDLNTDIKAITGQTNDVKLITWQYEVHQIGWDYYSAYVGIHDINPNIYCAFPGYIIPHIDDGEMQDNNIHFTSIGSLIAGEYMGIAFKRIILEGQDWKPMIPESAQIVGNNVILKLHVPEPPIKIDTNYVTEIKNYGFQLFDSSGNEKTIQVSLFGTDSIRIYCASGITGTDQIRYAYNPTKVHDNSYYPTDIARGNICDSQKIVSYSGRKLANFLVAFKKTINDLEV